jgi:hypothetical protein
MSIAPGQLLFKFNFVARDVAAKTFRVLQEYAPYPERGGERYSPYSIGSYMLSFRIGINGPSPDPYILLKLEEPFPNTKSIARREIQNKIGKPVKNLKSVVITNEVPHAEAVETGDWSVPYATAEGYYTFNKGMHYLSEHADRMIAASAKKYKERGAVK